MALTISTGFVVDDAIVVIENISRHLEQRSDAARRRRCVGAKEIGFTVVSMSVSLIAVFIPILLMGGIVGRLFREFAVTLSVAVAVSMLVSLTTTPMMCAQSAAQRGGRAARPALPGRPNAPSTCAARLRPQSDLDAAALAAHARWSRRRPSSSTWRCTSSSPRGSFRSRTPACCRERSRRPRTRRITRMLGDADRLRATASRRPGDRHRRGVHGRRRDGANSARMFISLKPLAERKGARRRGDRAAATPNSRASRGASLFFQAVQDIRVGGRHERTRSISSRCRPTTSTT